MSSQPEDTLTVNMKITGKVQGVGFRYFVLRQAQKLGINGWVSNKSNGDVEAFAQGDKTNLELFIEIQQQGSSFYRVDEMKLIWEHAGRIIQIFPLSNKCNSKYIPIFTDWREKK